MELTKEDVARLLADPSPEARAQVASKIGQQLSTSGFGATELKLAQDIVRHMAKDLAVQVRAALASSVKQAKELPHDVAMRLAQDVEQVSLPILEFSQILTDDDLVEIIHAHSPEKMTAIAKRENVSEKISGALVHEGTPEAVATLLANKTAHITEHTVIEAADKFGSNAAVQEKLVRRDKLPLAVAERLVNKVSDALKDYLVSHHKIEAKVADNLVVQSREQATVGLLGVGSDEQDLEKLAVQLKESGRLTPSLIVRALCVGDIPFFEAAMAALAGVPITNARVLIHDAGKMGMKSMYDRTKLPQGMYAIIRVALEVVKEMQMTGGDQGREKYRARVIERILTQYEDFNPEDLEYLLDRLSDLVEQAA